MGSADCSLSSIHTTNGPSATSSETTVIPRQLVPTTVCQKLATTNGATSIIGTPQTMNR